MLVLCVCAAACATALAVRRPACTCFITECLSCAGVREPSAAETPAQTLPPREQPPQQNHQLPQQPYSSGPLDAEAMLSNRLNQVGLHKHGCISTACCGSLLSKLCTVLLSEGLLCTGLCCWKTLKGARPSYGGALLHTACLGVAHGDVGGGQHLPRLLKGSGGITLQAAPASPHRRHVARCCSPSWLALPTAAAACHTLHAARHVTAG